MTERMNLNQRLISWRRFLHMHPETAGKEKNTAAYLAKELSQMGLAIKENIFGYGMVAELNGKETGKCIALRADMDALPVMEKTNLAYKSLTDGAMHACGHDAHMAVILGTAAELVKNPPPGKVKFIFQPSEEKPPGGGKILD
jgi:amidohydrolase